MLFVAVGRAPDILNPRNYRNRGVWHARAVSQGVFCGGSFFPRGHILSNDFHGRRRNSTPCMPSVAKHSYRVSRDIAHRGATVSLLFYALSEATGSNDSIFLGFLFDWIFSAERLRRFGGWVFMPFFVSCFPFFSPC